MGFFRSLFCLGPKKETGAKARAVDGGSHTFVKPQPYQQQYRRPRRNEAQPTRTYHVPQAKGYVNRPLNTNVTANVYAREPYPQPPVDYAQQQHFPHENNSGFGLVDGNIASWNEPQHNHDIPLVPQGEPGSVWSEEPAPLASQSMPNHPQLHPEVNELQYRGAAESYGGREIQEYAAEQYNPPLQYPPASPPRSYPPSHRHPSTDISENHPLSIHEQQPEGEFFGTLEPREPDSEPPDLTDRVAGMSNVPHFTGVYSDVHKGGLRNYARGEPQQIAIKVLKLVGDLGVMRRKFRREQQIWWSLVHPNIIPLLGYADYSNFGSLISPWCIHGDVTKYLTSTRPSIDERVQIWKGVARGIDYLHSHDPPVVHGDLKPANVLIDATGTPLVCDFGLSRAPREDGKHGGNTTTSAYHGTIRYVPRELVDEDSRFFTPHPTKESDVHALGCIGLEVIYLIKPYAHRSIETERTSFNLGADILQGIPPARRPIDTGNSDLWAWLEACWNLDPTARPEVRPLAIWLCLPPWIVPEDYDVPVVE